MEFGRLEQDYEYLIGKFRNPEFDPATGLDNETLKRETLALAERMAAQPHPVVKARAFEFVARNMRIDVSPHDWFPAFGCYDRFDRPLSPVLDRFYNEVCATKVEHRELWERLNRSGATNIWIDFDHSVPDWEAILPLGFPGILERARTYRKKHESQGTLTPRAEAYFDGIEITYRAVLETLDRFRVLALRNADGSGRLEREAECLRQLREGAPRDTYEALCFIYLYFMFGEYVDRMQVRSLGNLDNLLFPYFERDRESGRFTESQIREFFDYFMMQWASIDNYWGHPFYLGGTDAAGGSRINPLSYLILEEFDKLSVPTPKIQLKIAANTPDRFLDQALKMIRHGNSSLVFLGEEGLRHVMTGLGMTEEDARNCDIRGCYEFAARGFHNSNETACGHLNMLKGIELALHNGIDPATGLAVGVRTGELDELRSFDDFYRAYTGQLAGIIEDNILCVNDFERFLDEINPANFFSATILRSLETAEDAFCRGSYYNNTTLLNAGFGSAVDALMAIREFVYERRELTLAEFRGILAENWTGHEKLRRRILNSPYKFGNGEESVDRYADMLSRFIGTRINGRPNARGGIWEASAHSARQFIELGEKTGATPDGRFAGEEMSKNISPVQGADVSGVTALIESALRIDSGCFPGDFPLDVMLHPSAVAGGEGLAAWRTLIRTYMAGNGLAIHFNVFDAATLREAQLHPEKFAGLQIRVCGWNVRFVELAPREQEMYIRRAERLAP